MPRIRPLHILALVAPFLALFILFQSIPPTFLSHLHSLSTDAGLGFINVLAETLGVEWPLAIHPDFEEKEGGLEGNGQTVFEQPPPHDHHYPSQPGQYQHHIPVQYKAPPKHVEGQEKPYFSRRIVAVGDLHGDMPNAQKVLQMAGVVDAAGNWAGGVDFFVQTGDIIDRGDDTIKLYMWMDRLRAQAQDTGGMVLSHLGNHEWMNAIGDWRYVHPSEIKTFGSVPARQRMISTGRIGKTWAKNYTTTSRLPLHPSLGPPNTDYDPETHPLSPLFNSPLSHSAISFVHGGLAQTYPELTPFPSRINDIASSLLHKLQLRTPPPPHPPNPYPGLPASATEEENRLYGNEGPLWFRGWALETDEVVCAKVDDVLQRTGTRRMVMGHTPDFQRIVSRCGGKIIIIDTGISHAYGGALSALSVHYTLTPVVQYPARADGGVTETKTWVERELVTAIYEDREEVLAEDEREVYGDFY